MNHQEWSGCGADKERRIAHYRAADINGRLIINLRDIGHTMRALYEGKGSQKRILIVLSQVGKITQRELTEHLGIRPGSASEVIAKLEAAGLILRTPSSEDRRTADIELSEEGRRRAEEAIRQRQERHEEMFSCLSEEEKNTLLALVEKINSDWETRYRENGPACGHKDHPCGEEGPFHGHKGHRCGKGTSHGRE